MVIGLYATKVIHIIENPQPNDCSLRSIPNYFIWRLLFWWKFQLNPFIEYNFQTSDRRFVSRLYYALQIPL